MRLTICRGQSSSLVRVENRGRVDYFNAGRYLSDQRIAELAKSSRVNLRQSPGVNYNRRKNG